MKSPELKNYASFESQVVERANQIYSLHAEISRAIGKLYRKKNIENFTSETNPDTLSENLSKIYVEYLNYSDQAHFIGLDKDKQSEILTMLNKTILELEALSDKMNPAKNILEDSDFANKLKQALSSDKK